MAANDRPRDEAAPATRQPVWPPRSTLTNLRLDSGAWFDGTRKVIEIDHHGTIYRMRCTAQGKLILTK